ncbi:MAG: VWA domain-containing protein [Acidobacteria bacterium]|nr:VWA domain-containing protein [Acidobacteriota bacterium]
MALLTALALAASPDAAVPQQSPVFKSGTQTVALYVTITDAQKRLVPDLEKEDFEILDDGKPQPLTIFENEVQPITVVVMLDTSGSMTLTLDLVKAGAEQFLIRLLPGDSGRVGAFNDKIQISPRFTSDRDELIRYVKEDLDFGYPTRLYDAIDASIDTLREIEGRRVVLVFTDGDDTASRRNSGDVLEEARTAEIMIYGIGLLSDYFNGVQRVRTRPDRGLKKVAEDTGGGYFELKKTDELNSTFTRVAQELHSQYVLGFTPEALDGKVHKLEVRVKRPGMTARGRKTYLAVADRLGTGGKP